MTNGRFKKGVKSWNAGTRFHLEKECQKCHKTFIVSKPSFSGQKFCSISCGSINNKRKLGTKASFVTKMKMHTASVGKQKSEQHRANMSKARSGVKLPQITGEKHYLWVKDRALLKDDHKDRGGQLHREWSKTIKNRDGWKCKISNDDCDGELVAHHILGWSSYPELRYDINNGITLCHAHHPLKRAEEVRLAPVFQGLVAAIAH